MMMTPNEEKLLRDMLGDLLASKGDDRITIIENIVLFMKMIISLHSTK